MVVVSKQLMLKDRRKTIYDTASIVNVSYRTVQPTITNDLNMRHVTAEFVPRLLIQEKKHCIEVCRELPQFAMDDPIFMLRTPTSDRTWIYGYDAELKHQSSHWKSPSSPQVKRARQVHNSI